MSLFFFETILNQSPKAIFKSPVILVAALRWAFQVILALATGHLRHMAFHQQTIDILVRIPSSALMDGFRTFAQCQRRNTIILRDHDITPLAKINQRDVHCVCPGPDYTDLAVIRVEDVIRVSK